MPSEKDAEQIYQRIEKATGMRPTAVREIDRGYTKALRLIVQFPDRSSAFAKLSTDSITASWLRSEHQIYRHVQADFIAKLVAWDDDGAEPALVLEDLSRGIWPDKWTDETIANVLRMLESVRSTTGPAGLPTLESMRQDLASWSLVAKDPEPFLSLQLCSSDWLVNALPALIEADKTAPLAGADLVHMDVRSDNICFVGKRAILVDWNWACVGNGVFDLILWLPSLKLEGGPDPQSIISGEANLVALMTGYFAHRAPMAPPHPQSKVRDLQLEQLKVCLPWCADLLGLPPPDTTRY
jgi:hypothetical protein